MASYFGNRTGTRAVSEVRTVETIGSGNGVSWEVVSDRVLVEALRARQPAAVDEFLRRFEPIAARYARWLRVPSAERSHWVGELLYDVAMTLGRGRGEPPRHLGAYVAGACRLRARDQRATEVAHQRRVLEALATVHDGVYGHSESVVVGLCSESSLRDARGPDWEAPPLAPVLERLLSAFDEGATPDERRILKWLGEQISYTKIAEWLGITRPAAVSRIQRLRAGLIESAFRFGAGLDAPDRVEFVRFLRRTRAVDDERVLALERFEGTGTASIPVRRGASTGRNGQYSNGGGTEEDSR